VCINNGTLVHSEINFILPRRGKFSRDIRANPRIDYRQAQRKPKEYGRAISLNNHKILDT